MDIVDAPLQAEPLPHVPAVLDHDTAVDALLPRANAAVHPDAMPGPAGDCPLETATGIVTDVELPTFDMQLKLPELNVSFNSDD